MRKYYLLGLLILSSSLLGTASANTGFTISVENNAVTIKSATPTKAKKKFIPKPRPLTLWQFFIDVCGRLWQWAPTVYRDINVYWQNVKKGTELYESLQKCIYFGILEQRSKITNYQGYVKGAFVTDFLQKKFNLSFPYQLAEDENVPMDIWEQEIHYRVPTYYGIQKLMQLSSWSSNESYESPLIRSNMFNTLSTVYSQIQQNYHYDTGDVSDNNLMYGAINGIVWALHDQYSVYFPPDQSADFYQSIQWEYYGVWMYVEVVDGKMTVSALVPNAPAGAAWIQAKDIIFAIDDREVPAQFNLNDAIRRIKWPVDTTVKLTLIRDGIKTVVSVVRKKIVIPMIQTSKQSQSVVFTITSFGAWLTDLFKQDVEKYKDDIKNARNIIIDVRNNPGGYLEEAAGILSLFVKKWEPVVIMELKNQDYVYTSIGTDTSLFSGKQIYVLTNWGTASASEILAGSLKDYYPTLKVIWEKSYGKWSAQTTIGLPNGGTVKYTVALWYTGKTRTSIEKKGITPDHILKDDTKTPTDEILQTVLSW